MEYIFVNYDQIQVFAMEVLKNIISIHKYEHVKLLHMVAAVAIKIVFHLEMNVNGHVLHIDDDSLIAILNKPRLANHIHSFLFFTKNMNEIQREKTNCLIIAQFE